MPILIRQPRLIPLLALRAFLPWYFFGEPIRIIRAYGRWAKAVHEMFNVFFLLRYLLSPWKAIRGEYPSQMLALEKVISAFSMNLVSRGVGCVMRVLAIVAALVLQIVVFATFALLLIVWITAPALMVIAFLSVA